MKEEIYDLTAYSLDEAINILQRKGIKFKLKKTLPPFSLFSESINENLFTSKYRVVRYTTIDKDTVELLITPVI